MATAATKTFKNFIGGEWVDAASGETFETSSPATGETLGVFPRSSADDVDRAVEAAKAAYDDWRLTPAPKRGEILFQFGRLLADRKDEIAELIWYLAQEPATPITGANISIDFGISAGV